VRYPSEIQAEGDDPVSVANKRKFEADEESSVQPAKRFKQDTSDITGDTEPFDFCGGEE
jgi:hypothetical protein